MCTPSMPACGAALPTSLSRPTMATGARQALQRERGGCCTAMTWPAHRLKAVCWRHQAPGIVLPAVPNFSCTRASCSLCLHCRCSKKRRRGSPACQHTLSRCVRYMYATSASTHSIAQCNELPCSQQPPVCMLIVRRRPPTACCWHHASTIRPRNAPVHLANPPGEQDVARQAGIPAFDFVKIDIEGAEGQVGVCAPPCRHA